MWLMDRPPANKSPEYKAWYQMNRVWGGCVDPSWRWVKGDYDGNNKAFNRFRQCVGLRPKGHVLVRLDKGANFSAGNVRWGTHTESNLRRGPYRKFACARDGELLAELERRGYLIA